MEGLACQTIVASYGGVNHLVDTKCMCNGPNGVVGIAVIPEIRLYHRMGPQQMNGTILGACLLVHLSVVGEVIWLAKWNVRHILTWYVYSKTLHLGAQGCLLQVCDPGYACTYSVK